MTCTLPSASLHNAILLTIKKRIAMKRLLIICAVVAVVLLALIGCEDGSNLTNFGWISFA